MAGGPVSSRGCNLNGPAQLVSKFEGSSFEQTKGLLNLILDYKMVLVAMKNRSKPATIKG